MVWLGFREEELDPSSEVSRESVTLIRNTFPWLGVTQEDLESIRVVRATSVRSDYCVSSPAIMCCRIARKYIYVYLRCPDWVDGGVNVWLEYRFRKKR